MPGVGLMVRLNHYALSSQKAVSRVGLHRACGTAEVGLRGAVHPHG